jgi:hypothetical protein
MYNEELKQENINLRLNRLAACLLALTTILVNDLSIHRALIHPHRY